MKSSVAYDERCVRRWGMAEAEAEGEVEVEIAEVAAAEAEVATEQSRIL